MKPQKPVLRPGPRLTLTDIYITCARGIRRSIGKETRFHADELQIVEFLDRGGEEWPGLLPMAFDYFRILLRGRASIWPVFCDAGK